MSWEPASLWDYLKDNSDGKYKWLKEERTTNKCYVCYLDGKEIGFIAVEYEKTDVKWRDWWIAAYQRYNELTLKDLMDEIEHAA